MTEFWQVLTDFDTVYFKFLNLKKQNYYYVDLAKTEFFSKYKFLINYFHQFHCFWNDFDFLLSECWQFDLNNCSFIVKITVLIWLLNFPNVTLNFYSFRLKMTILTDLWADFDIVNILIFFNSKKQIYYFIH